MFASSPQKSLATLQLSHPVENTLPLEKTWYTAPEAAEVLGVSDQFIRNAYDS